MASDFVCATGMFYTNAQSFELLVVAQTLNDVFQTVVATGSATLFEARDTRGKVQLVVCDENLLGSDSVEISQSGDCFTRSVHKRVGSQQA